MCCDICYKYEECDEDSKLREECCSRCFDYNDCIGVEDRDKDSSQDTDHYTQEEDYS